MPKSARFAKSVKKESKPAQPRRKGRKINTPIDSDDEEGQVEVEDVSVDWKDIDLTWSLLNAITEDKEIKQGLFPSPGSDHRASKGKPKSDHHFSLAKVVFASHPKYQASFAGATTSAEKGLWTRKIKNRLSSLIKTCRLHTAEMGETGAGITREDEIDMSLNNEFTTKWGLIQVSFPWYWTLKELISELPNCNPVGVGNTATGFDVDILQSSAITADLDDDDSSTSTKSSDSEPAAADEDMKPLLSKRTKAKPSTSAPAAPPKKAKTIHGKFADIAAKEEETAQELLKVKQLKVRSSTELDIARINARNLYCIRRAELKAQLQERRDEREFQYRLALAQQNTAASQHQRSFSSPSFSSPNFSSPNFSSSSLSELPLHLPVPFENPGTASSSEFGNWD